MSPDFASLHRACHTAAFVPRCREFASAVHTFSTPVPAHSFHNFLCNISHLTTFYAALLSGIYSEFLTSQGAKPGQCRSGEWPTLGTWKADAVGVGQAVDRTAACLRSPLIAAQPAPDELKLCALTAINCGAIEDHIAGRFLALKPQRIDDRAQFLPELYCRQPLPLAPFSIAAM